jgi:uncharacterized membrane protein required for colicin V production
MQNIVELSRQLNWVDILVLIVFLRLTYISMKQGLGVEFFKLSGSLFALYLALHYYFSFAAFLNGYTRNLAPEITFVELITFVILFAFGYLFFWSIRIATFRFMTAEVNSEFSKWGGFVCALFRSCLLTSLILFALVLPGNAYFKDSVRYSFSGNYFSKVAPATYTFIWESIVSKFNSGEKYNSAVQDIYPAEAKQKKKNK